jgi:hypothetical protein
MAFIRTSIQGAGSQVLEENQALVWGPLSLPARVTASGFRLAANAGWTQRAPAFDLYLLTDAEYTSRYTTSQAFAPIESTLLTQRVVATTAESVVELALPSSLSAAQQVYFVVDNRPNGGRAPDPGASVTVAWDDFRWVTDASRLNLTSACGNRTVNTGPGQALTFGPLDDTPVGVTAIATATATTATAQLAAFIFDATNVQTYLAGGQFSTTPPRIGVICSSGVRCSTPFVPGTSLFFVLGASGSGRVTSTYRVNDCARTSTCPSGNSFVCTATTAATAATAATSSSSTTASTAATTVATTSTTLLTSTAATSSTTSPTTSSTTPSTTSSATLAFGSLCSVAGATPKLFVDQCGRCGGNGKCPATGQPCQVGVSNCPPSEATSTATSAATTSETATTQTLATSSPTDESSTTRAPATTTTGAVVDPETTAMSSSAARLSRWWC